METEQKEALEQCGIDFTGAMDRFGNNETLFKRLALKYLNDPHYPALEEALEAQNAEAAFREAHALKGLAGNLSFTLLYTTASNMSDALRAKDVALAQTFLTSLREAQTLITQALESLQNEDNHS